MFRDISLQERHVKAVFVSLEGKCHPADTPSWLGGPGSCWEPTMPGICVVPTLHSKGADAASPRDAGRIVRGTNARGAACARAGQDAAMLPRRGSCWEPTMPGVRETAFCTQKGLTGGALKIHRRSLHAMSIARRPAAELHCTARRCMWRGSCWEPNMPGF
jgi:hypothetical protein